MLLFMFSIISFGNENQFMKEIFERKGLNGTFVVYDLKNDKIDYYNLDRANERFYPASSFKIFNTLIGFIIMMVLKFFLIHGQKIRI